MSDGATAPILDPQPLRALEVGSPGISAAVLAVYERDLRAFVAQLPVLVQGGDAELVRRAAHKLKGSSAAIGARQVQGDATALERDCRESGRIAGELVAALLRSAEAFLSRPG